MSILTSLHAYVDRQRQKAAIRELHRITTERANSPAIRDYRVRSVAGKLGHARKRAGA